MDNLAAYSPKGADLATGLIAVLASPNKLTGSLLVVGGVAVDTISTYWDKRKERRAGRRDNAD